MLKSSPLFMETERPLPCLRSYHWTLLWANWIHSPPTHIITIKSILIFYPHLCQNLKVASFFKVVWQQLYIYLISFLHTTCPTHHTILDLMTLITYDGKNILWSSWLCGFLSCPVFWCLFNCESYNKYVEVMYLLLVFWTDISWIL